MQGKCIRTLAHGHGRLGLIHGIMDVTAANPGHGFDSSVVERAIAVYHALLSLGLAFESRSELIFCHLLSPRPQLPSATAYWFIALLTTLVATFFWWQAMYLQVHASTPTCDNFGISHDREQRLGSHRTSYVNTMRMEHEPIIASMSYDYQYATSAKDIRQLP